ncbi:hypothetical protein CAEBREN_16324 [Caenorhabditis brenneri]|uniref:Uncharacterized protein n=1 Tax=Caenorhabditis brenneri TaxID=135651 RepID=G0NIR1_CAEBE|nr:hypothetical protein CAEBREN_16324 [Caenorhabditis brenneri]
MGSFSSNLFQCALCKGFPTVINMVFWIRTSLYHDFLKFFQEFPSCSYGFGTALIDYLEIKIEGKCLVTLFFFYFITFSGTTCYSLTENMVQMHLENQQYIIEHYADDLEILFLNLANPWVLRMLVSHGLHMDLTLVFNPDGYSLSTVFDIRKVSVEHHGGKWGSRFIDPQSLTVQWFHLLPQYHLCLNFIYA